MSETGDGAGPDRGSDPLMVAAGAADLAISGVGAALRAARTLLSRSDLVDLARTGQEELARRGRLAVLRAAPLAESHMEVVARRAAAQAGRSDA